MSTKTKLSVKPKEVLNSKNNIVLRQLVDDSGLSIPAALMLFNAGQMRPISESGFKAWLAKRSSVRWREITKPEYVEHAKKVFSEYASRKKLSLD